MQEDYNNKVKIFKEQLINQEGRVNFNLIKWNKLSVYMKDKGEKPKRMIKH